MHSLPMHRHYWVINYGREDCYKGWGERWIHLPLNLHLPTWLIAQLWTSCANFPSPLKTLHTRAQDHSDTIASAQGKPSALGKDIGWKGRRSREDHLLTSWRAWPLWKDGDIPRRLWESKRVSVKGWDHRPYTCSCPNLQHTQLGGRIPWL